MLMLRRIQLCDLLVDARADKQREILPFLISLNWCSTPRSQVNILLCLAMKNSYHTKWQCRFSVLFQSHNDFFRLVTVYL